MICRWAHILSLWQCSWAEWGSGGWISWDQIGGRMFPWSWDRIFLSFFMRSKFLIMIWSPDCSIFHEIEIQKSIIRNFDLMIDLLAASTIMRSKFKINYLNLVSCTCGNFLALIISHLCIKTFDLMIALAANKSIMRLKFPNNAFLVLISWSIC